MKVKNVYNKDGRAVANKFIILDDGMYYFQSYDSVIARWDSNGIELDETYWDYSRTTARWRNYVLGMTTDEIKAAIKFGKITLTRLND